MWEQIGVHPVLRSTTAVERTAKLSAFAGAVPEWKSTSFPRHIVAVPRTVKLITETSAKVIWPTLVTHQAVL